MTTKSQKRRQNIKSCIKGAIVKDLKMVLRSIFFILTESKNIGTGTAEKFAAGEISRSHLSGEL